MKGNEFSSRELNTDATNWLKKLHQTLIVKEYGKGTIRNYCQEMTLLFKYYNDKPVSKIMQTNIEQYLQYLFLYSGVCSCPPVIANGERYYRLS